MTTIAPEIALAGMRWTAESLARRENWKFAAPAALARDTRTLSLWAATVADPVASLRRGTLDLPSVARAGRQGPESLNRGLGLTGSIACLELRCSCD
jgi:hypothetical protein